MKIMFMGTPDFSATILEKIIQSGHEIIGVVTQPDKQKGRGQAVSYTPVKELALQHDLPVYQPVRVRAEEFLQKVRELEPEAIVVAAFGQILPKALLEIPPCGCINVHASLLPKYRGAAPIQYSIIDGEKETGVTIMQMDVGIDNGDILLQEKLPITPEDTGGSLFDKLAILGGELIIEALNKIENKTIIRIPQDDSKATHVKMISKEMGRMDFTQPAVKLERLIRGLNPWPSAYTVLDGKNVKLWKADALEAGQAEQSGSVPGEIIKINKDSFEVMTGDGILAVKELQLEGKKRLPADAFLRGYPVKAGTKLG